MSSGVFFVHVNRFKGASKLFNMFSGGSSSSKKAKAVSGTAEAGTEVVDDADLDADKYVTYVTHLTVSPPLLHYYYLSLSSYHHTVSIVPAIAVAVLPATATATASLNCRCCCYRLVQYSQ
jgi:hypothetical protein